MYSSLYEYFMRNSGGGDWSKCLEGETLKGSPTQKELTDAVKKVWAKLGGTVAAVFLITAQVFADVLPSTLWQDIPPTNSLVEALNAWPSPTPERTQLGSYLWEIGTENEDFTKATNRFAHAYPSFGGACSGLCTTRYHGRNLDWYYNKQVSTVIRKSETASSLGFIGVGDGVLDESLVSSGAWTNAYWSVPFSLSDGMNTRGVVIQQNVLYKKPYSEWPSGSVDWKSKRSGSLILFCMIRYALERATNALNAAEILRDKTYVPEEFAYDIHFLVSDTSTSYIVEDGKIYSSADNIPVDNMTNFRIGGVTFDATTKKVSDWTTVEPYGMGVERYDLLREDSPSDLDGMVALMKSVWFTKAYTELTDRWLTELCTPSNTPPLTVQLAKTNPSSFDTAFQQERNNYLLDHNDPSHYRTGLSWQTVHMSIYDKENLTLHLYTQEDATSEKVLTIGGPAVWATAGKSIPQTDLSSRTTFEQATNAAVGAMSKVRINGQQLSENVSITTFAAFPSTWRCSDCSMDDLCVDIGNDSSAVPGMCFLGELSGMTPMPDIHLGNCEVIVKICTEGVFNFEVYSTDTGTKHWDGVGDAGGFIEWRQVVTAPEVTANGEYMVKMTVAYNGQSKNYAWVPFSTPSGGYVSTNALQGQTFDFSTMNGVYSGLKAVIEKLGGTVNNAPASN